MDSITESPYPVCCLGPELPKSASFGSLLAFDLADLGRFKPPRETRKKRIVSAMTSRLSNLAWLYLR
jgi:hypothetical protein